MDILSKSILDRGKSGCNCPKVGVSVVASRKAVCSGLQVR